MQNVKISERAERVKKLQELRKLGINPYPAQTEKTHTIADVQVKFSQMEKGGEIIAIAGRLRGSRAHGNLTFANLQDSTGKIQIALSKKEVGPDNYKIFIKLIDVGDFIEAKGICFTTHKGEKTVMVKEWRLLAKALKPLPDKWHGLRDEEERLRKRYLDILFNPEVREMIEKKAAFWRAAREFMLKKGFLEVETPVLETTTGGADARPFITRHNALDMNVYLRISMGELWQKRLMVAGFEKTFEIGRQFRNEGIDAEHLQDYAQMEFYWAYADYEKGMEFVEELYKFVAQETFSTLKFQIGKFKIDLSKKWERYDYRETVKKLTGIDILNADIKQIEKKLKELKIEYDKKGFNITRAIDNLWKYCRKQIAGPGFLIGVPVEISPLAKKDDNNPKITQRFQPIIAGSELGNGYSELNDPIDQAERFAEQQKLREAGDEEAQMFDHEFVEALEYGMPPTCGFGMSERVFAFLMDKSMRECQIFPLMKPKSRNIKHET
jgi:lysyl-tRNA synthetase class 2